MQHEAMLALFATLPLLQQATTMKVAGCQMPVGDVGVSLAANEKALLTCIDQAAAGGAQWLVTPEGSLSGYGGAPGGRSAQATEAVEPALKAAELRVRQAAVAKSLGLWLGTLWIERGPNNASLPYDQQRVYSPDGSFLGWNAKQLLTTNPTLPGVSEAHEFIAGKPTVFDISVGGNASTGGVKAGGLICNDMWADPTCSTHDPMLTHVMAWEFGARMVFHSINGGPGRIDVILPFHDSNVQYRAMASKLFIATAQAAQADGQNAHSGLCAPNGTWVAQVPLGQTGVYVGTVEL